VLEEARKSTRDFVWAVRPCAWILANEEIRLTSSFENDLVRTESCSALSGFVIRVFGGFPPMRELMHERDHLPDLLF
jgi:hypothetical protein